MVERKVTIGKVFLFWETMTSKSLPEVVKEIDEWWLQDAQFLSVDQLLEMLSWRDDLNDMSMASRTLKVAELMVALERLTEAELQTIEAWISGRSSS